MFMFVTENGFEEITLSGMAVEGLIKMNEGMKRDKTLDLRFVKAMLIGFCTIKQVKVMKEQAEIGMGILTTMKGRIDTKIIISIYNYLFVSF